MKLMKENIGYGFNKNEYLTFFIFFNCKTFLDSRFRNKCHIIDDFLSAMHLEMINDRFFTIRKLTFYFSYFKMTKRMANEIAEAEDKLLLKELMSK